MMKFRFSASVAILACCISCVEINGELGSNLLPKDQNYKIFIEERPIDEIELKMCDSLSGYSQTQVVIGAIRDAEGRLSARSSAMTLVPLRRTMDFGKNPKFKSFHLAIASDTVSMDDTRYAHIIQGVKVYELDKALNPSRNFDCNAKLTHKSKSIVKNSPVLNGSDSLRIEFTEEYGKRFFELTSADLHDFDKYTEKIPGIYIETDTPIGTGGRINNMELQLNYDTDMMALVGNYASLRFSAEYDGVVKDTSFLFYLGATNIVNGDSLVMHTGSGAYYNQYALNLTDEESVREREGKADDDIFICGGGGIKPKISAQWLRKAVSEMIAQKGGNPKTAIINKASLILPFEFPEDYLDMSKYPKVLSPTTRILTDTTATFVSLTDASDETENAGEVNRSLLCYSPDFTFHMQTLLTLDDDNEDLLKGSYDIWLLVMDYYTVATDNSSEELSQYYQQLAYQSYYNNMYGGYGGYGGYGYGYDSYTNYYNYMMMAQYAANNVTTNSTLMLDISKYYRAYLCGPQAADPNKRPKLKVTFSIPEN